ncbi:MAG TPA: 2-C-methyl-D-erythritol 4-phosphate cytidylyltransferase [Firmicutes bacterium]|jgi:2-C-methyl-D-erythritol 4-phosphate cytidylyltransferase|nr:2-C-methyl-D-erythritol 4-phosphate cytidylyltransferase [Bacillota bacterium]HAA37843.1 2-C-methyl-D-erythritol 4-phosphate cytidylyltransferase [Bacillota bacterium]
MSSALIVAAAGQGRRMKSKLNKQYLKLAGRPLLTYSLTAALEAACFTQIIVVVTPGEEELFHRDVLLPFFPGQKLQVVAGGKERQDSVRNGLAALTAEITYVCVHDGARPLAEASLFKECLQTAQAKGAAIAAVPVKDTIKIVDEQRKIVQTPPRGQLWAAQTPQVFRRDWLELAHQRAHREGFQGTDDASLLERYGYPVQIIEAGYDNLKITTPEDLLLAEAILRRRSNAAGNRL